MQYIRERSINRGPPVLQFLGFISGTRYGNKQKPSASDVSLAGLAGPVSVPLTAGADRGRMMQSLICLHRRTNGFSM